jgi:hypothetical protein
MISSLCSLTNREVIDMKRVLFIFSGLFLCVSLHAQIQKGSDIDGVETGENSGFSVCMSDANTVAIGAPENDVNGGDSGQVRVFSWSGSQWIQKGEALNGSAAGDLFGSVLCMPNANTIAVGAPQNDAADVDAGQVTIFEWDGFNWFQKGSVLAGEATPGFFGGLFGSSVDMPNPNTIVVGAPWFDETGLATGEVYVYDWNGSDWVQRGESIVGSAFSYFGSVVTMPDPNVIAVAKQGATAANVGAVTVYEWNNSSWQVKGVAIEGELAGDYSGNSIDMPDANTIAISAIENDGSFPQAGHVRIFQWDGSAWVQKGSDIDGEAQGDESGNSVSMPNANTIAIGAILNDGNGMQSGHTRIFTWDGTDWVQLGIDIDGEEEMDQSGHSVSMPDANTVAIGAIRNDAINGADFLNEAGHVRVFIINEDFVESEAPFARSFDVFPNPTQGKCILKIDDSIAPTELTLKLYDALGREVWTNTSLSAPTIELEIPERAGVYHLSVQSNSSGVVFKIVRE